MPAFLPASLHARRQAVGTRTSTVLHTTSIRTSVVLVPGVGRTRTVLYCTTCRYGSPHFRTGCVRYLFEMRSIFVRDSFGIRSGCLPASLHACRQAVGTRTSTLLHTTSTVYSYISRTRGRSYGTVGAAMRPRCGDPPNKVTNFVCSGVINVVSVRPETTVRTVCRTSLQYRYSSSAAPSGDNPYRYCTRTFQRLSCCSRTYGNPYWYSYNRSVAALPPSARDCTYRTAKVTFILHLACLPPAFLPACLFPSCLPACLPCTSIIP